MGGVLLGELRLTYRRDSGEHCPVGCQMSPIHMHEVEIFPYIYMCACSRWSHAGFVISIFPYPVNESHKTFRQQVFSFFPIKIQSSRMQSLSHQYGGMHSGSWVDYFPPSWIPFIQLSRLSPPAGICLIYFPHIFGVAHVANVCGLPANDTIRTCVALLAGSFFCSNASHAWNDLVDAEIDKRIPRTRNRPIPRGAVRPMAAFIFTAVQALCAAVILLSLSAATVETAIPSIITTIYYPYAKRHTNFAQVVLGFCLAWGVMVGSSAGGMPRPWTDTSTLCLFLASLIWVVIFDTIYAHQDLLADIKVGVGSTAVKFGESTKSFLWALFICMATLLSLCGYDSGMRFPYYIISVGGGLSSVAAMISRVNLDDPTSCWAWFSSGFWVTGSSIAGGLLFEYALG